MKYKHIIILLLLLSVNISFAQESPAPRKKVAVVLSGGGAKGMAHIGVLKVLERAGIPVDIITGTSMGSIIGGLYSIGYDAQTMDSLVRCQDWLFLLSDRSSPNHWTIPSKMRANTYLLQKEISFKRDVSEAGFITGKNLAVLFNELVGEYGDSIDFNSLPIPYACVATNIIDNTEYDFHKGTLPQAMRASMAIPGVFSPVKLQDMVLVDGGLRNNYPVDVAREMGADIVIGVTLQGDGKTADDLKNMVGVISQIVDVNCKNKYDENIAATDVHLQVDTKGYSAASFTKAAIDTLIRRGEETAMKRWDDLIALKKVIGIDDSFTPRQQIPPKPGNQLLSKETNDKMLAGLGVRFDNEERVAMQGNIKIPLKTKMPTSLEGTLRLGKRIMGRIDYSIHMDSLYYNNTPKLMGRLSYIYRKNDLNIYNEGNKDYNITYNQNTFEVSLLNFNIKNFNIELGATFDYYNTSSLLTSSGAAFPEEMDEKDHYFRYYARVIYNSENNWNFPTRGSSFQAKYAYYTDNLSKLNGNSGMTAISAMWRTSFLLAPRLMIQPMTYGRLLFGSQQPMYLRNMIGGEWFGHYTYQQMPLVGVGYMEMADAHFVAAQLKIQQQIGKDHYVLLTVSGAEQADRLKDLTKDSVIFGVKASYCHNSLFGPLGTSIGYSTLTKELNFYINLGYEF